MAAEGHDRWNEAIRKILDPSDGLYAAGGVERLQGNAFARGYASRVEGRSRVGGPNGAGGGSQPNAEGGGRT